MSAVAGAENPLSPPAEEASTKFRPSKKYLKWKFENSSPSASNDSPQSTTPVSSPGNEETVKPFTGTQPPLPPYSPPPGVYIKEEVHTTNYEDREPEPCLGFAQSLSTFNTPKAKPKETMCRNFVRGICKNAHTCKFVHKIIKDQLKYVYTFCKEFQNKGCTRQDCLFVHCTVFEQEKFFRTGELPPYATEHIKQCPPRFHKASHFKDHFQVSPQSQMLSEPTMNTSFDTSATILPVASTPLHTNGPSYGQSMYQYEPGCSTSYNKPAWNCDVQFHVSPQHQTVPQPTVNTPFDTSAAIVPGVSTPLHANGTDAQNYGHSAYQYEPACSTSNKRPWSVDDTDYTQRDLDFREPQVKKCEDCDKNEYRCEFYKNKAKELIADDEKNKMKVTQLNKKTERLIEVLKYIGQPVDYLEI